MAEETDVEKGGTLVRKLTLHDAVLFGIGAAIGSGILFAAPIPNRTASCSVSFLTRVPPFSTSVSSAM